MSARRAGNGPQASPGGGRRPSPNADQEFAADRAHALTLIPVSRETVDRLDRYVAVLLRWQQRINLVAPSTEPNIWTRHVADSLQLLALAPKARIWADLGSGAGFPGVAIACALADVSDARVYLVETNTKKMQSVSFETIGDNIGLTIRGDTATYRIDFGNGKWNIGQTTRSGPSLLTGATHHDVGLPAFRIAGSYQWIDDRTLKLVLRYIEGPHTETMICHLDGDKLTIDDLNSFQYGKGTITIHGTRQ